MHSIRIKLEFISVAMLQHVAMIRNKDEFVAAQLIFDQGIDQLRVVEMGHIIQSGCS
jgi:hypothetical protein